MRQMMREKLHDFSHMERNITFDPGSVSPPPLTGERVPAITSMALDISGQCNLRCAYCAEYATLPERAVMPPKIRQRAVDAVFEWSPKGCGVSIHLGSGEALLNPAAVLEIGRQARRLAQIRNRPLALYITTNGTLLDDAIMRWFIGDGWNVKISIDGGAQVHDRYRVYKNGKGTFRRIEHAVRTLAGKMPVHFSTTSVLCRGTDPVKVFYEIASMGVRKIELVPVATTSPSQLSLRDDDLAAYHDFIFDYAERIAGGEKLPTHIRFQKRLKKALGYGNTRIPCGAGRNFIAAGHDGKLYPCFRFVGASQYIMGDLDSGINPERVKWFGNEPGRPYEKRDECAMCWAAALCGGPCFACAELLGRAGSPSHDYCSMVRSESEAAVWLADVLKDEHPQLLLDLLGVNIEV